MTPIHISITANDSDNPELIVSDGCDHQQFTVFSGVPKETGLPPNVVIAVKKAGPTVLCTKCAEGLALGILAAISGAEHMYGLAMVLRENGATEEVIAQMSHDTLANTEIIRESQRGSEVMSDIVSKIVGQVIANAVEERPRSKRRRPPFA